MISTLMNCPVKANANVLEAMSTSEKPTPCLTATISLDAGRDSLTPMTIMYTNGITIVPQIVEQFSQINECHVPSLRALVFIGSTIKLPSSVHIGKQLLTS
mmetsp:Transcript_88612/g.228538  ORF Transcript_88612/g.228538 Transcript_88612/m.228538 type:complete len:101 (-) Transcript_88612:523-825(-)